MGSQSTWTVLLIQAMVLTAAASADSPGPGPKDAAGGHPLWRIGSIDGGNAELALAPGDYARFKDDGFFVVGRSDAKRDWPYVQPGPEDSWARSRRHSFAIVFGAKGQAPKGTTCTLRVALLDSQKRTPAVKFTLNGHSQTQRLPAGGPHADASICGKLEQAKHSCLSVEFPIEAVQKGPNVLTITTLSGSWLLYDGLEFFAPDGIALAPASGTVISDLEAEPGLKASRGELFQTARLTVIHVGDQVAARLTLGGLAAVDLALEFGSRSVDVRFPAAGTERMIPITIERDRKTLATRSFVVKPERKLTVYILPHSHTDIGYTEIQTRIEQKQVDNLLQGIALARRTASYPEGARFVWNVEVLWAAELYLKRLGPEKRALFLEAVKQGQVALNGMCLNELTGLCRPEELFHLFRCSTKLGELTGVRIDSAMISDVPGYTWGTVTAMAHAGIKYFSAAPNYAERIGDILVKWQNKPFYWVSPSGKERVLVWIPFKGYALSHILGQLTPQFVGEYLVELDKTRYPYDIAYIRWSGHGDNAAPDPAICEFARDWNSEHAWPRFVISSTSQAFRAFEARYGKTLPEARGDWTPYWEDGAGSSALETGMNRASADRLTQAETMWAISDPASDPASSFEDAWRNVLLYSEHTWGAYCSITDPASPLTQEQWLIKRGYASQANLQARQLLVSALAKRDGAADVSTAGPDIDVFNTSSWPRTDLVIGSAG